MIKYAVKTKQSSYIICSNVSLFYIESLLCYWNSELNLPIERYVICIIKS